MQSVWKEQSDGVPDTHPGSMILDKCSFRPELVQRYGNVCILNTFFWYKYEFSYGDLLAQLLSVMKVTTRRCQE